MLVHTVSGRWQTVGTVSFGKHFADLNVVRRMAYGSSRVMVWVALSYRQQTSAIYFWQLECTERHSDEILGLIILAFIHLHCLILQHDNVKPQFTRSVYNSWRLKTFQFLHGLHTHPSFHLFNTFALNQQLRQQVSIPTNI